MIDPASQAQLRKAIADCIGSDQEILDTLREEIRPLRSVTRRIQPRSTTSISLVGTNGGNNQLQFDPFLIQFNWFVGDPDVVDYTYHDQVVHSSPTDFVADLRRVWRNAESVCAEDATMVIRFGGITDRRAEPLDLIRTSLDNSGWRITAVENAGTAMAGKRQANAFLRTRSNPMVEYDIWATRS